MTVQELNASGALNAVKSWAVSASRGDGPSNHPSVDALRYVLATPKRSIVGVDPEPTVVAGRSLVGFQIIGEGNVGTKTRFMLPVHFAAMRGLELIPGVKIRLNDDPHHAVFRRKGVERPDSELIYSLSIRSDKAVAEVCRLPKRSRLDRILFNAPPDATLHERRGSDHHCIVPASSVLIRTRRIHAQTQQTWLKVAESSVEKARLQDTLADLPEVLRLLFVTADRWHWSELIDRLDGDPRLAAA